MPFALTETIRDYGFGSVAQEDKSSIMRILSTTSEFKPTEVIVAEEVIDSYFS